LSYPQTFPPQGDPAGLSAVSSVKNSDGSITVTPASGIGNVNVGLNTAGTTNAIVKYTGATTLGNSSITDNGTIVSFAEPEVFLASATLGAFNPQIGQDGSGILRLNSASGVNLEIGGAGQVTLTSSNLSLFSAKAVVTSGGKFGAYNAILTAGLGVPAVYGAYASGSQNGALTTVGGYTPPAQAGTYEVAVTVYCTVGTVCSFSVKVNYVDFLGTVHNDIFPLASVSAPGAFLTNGLVIAAGTYHCLPQQIAINNAATPITFSTVGTFTTVTYYLFATIKQVA
jgi:hypothetical protein